jgi:oligopeptide/dipeptide ABC transporter ATP-binding protein
MSPAEELLKVESLQLSYRTKHGLVRAIRDASLEIGAGEAVGLVGESGSGKSSLALAVMGLLPARASSIESGRILIAGRDVTRLSDRQWERMRGRPAAIVFQDPLSYLNPVMRVGAQIAESVSRHDPSENVAQRVDELLSLVKLPASCVRAYPHELSGGMRQRALLAAALGCRPQLLIADEPTTALDVTTQAEILLLLNEMRLQLNMALLLISHDLAVVSAACQRVYVMYAGYTVEWGRSDEVFSAPAHPYTQSLLRSAESLPDERLRFPTIEGNVPDPAEAIEGCPFAPRCAHRTETCSTAMPAARTYSTAHHVARCWLEPASRAACA